MFYCGDTKWMKIEMANAGFINKAYKWVSA
jgi:hypothetical protein